MKKVYAKAIRRDVVTAGHQSPGNISTGRQPFNLTEYVDAGGGRGIEERSDSSTEGERSDVSRSSNLLCGVAEPTDFDRASTL